MASNNKTVRRGVELYIDGKEIKNDIASVEREARKLTKELRNMAIGSDEYNRKAKKLKELNGVLAEHRMAVRSLKTENEGMLSSLAGWMNKWGAVLAAASASLAGFTMAVMKYRKELLEREDTKADVKALTGLDDKSIQWLEEQAKTLSTTMIESGIRIRSSATEILEAYKLVGSAKPELLQNKEALNEVTKQAMILSQAAGIELKDAVDAVTLSMNQYGAAANDAARYANVMAAGSKYGAAAVANVTSSVKKAGVAAATAGVPIEQLVGSIEALAEKGIKNELAGTGLKTFFLKLEKQSKDVRPSVVGLQTALENLAARNLSTQSMIKMFGLTTYTVAQAMIESAQKVKYYSDTVTGTAVATEQAAIKSDTAAAKLAQLKNQFSENGQILAEQLAPAMMLFVGWANRIVRALPPLINYIKSYGGEMIILASAIAVLTLRVKLYNALLLTSQAITGAITKTIAGFRAAMVLCSDAIAGCSMATKRLSVLLAAQNILVKASVAVITMLKTAYYLLTFQLGAATKAFSAFRVALASTGWGALIVAIGSAVAAIYSHIKAVREQQRAWKEAYDKQREIFKQYHDEKAEIAALTKIIDSNTASYARKRDALARLHEMVPDYHGALDKEGKLIDDNRDSLEQYLDKLKQTILYETKYEQLKGLYKRKEELEELQPGLSEEYWKIRQRNTLHGYDRNSFVNRVGSALRNSKLGKLMGWDAGTEKGAKNALDACNKELAETEKLISEIEGEIGKIEETSDSPTAPKEDAGDPEDPTDEKGKKERLKKELLAIDAKYDQKAAEAKMRYIQGKISTEQEYSDILQAIELARLDEKMRVQGLEESQRADFFNKMMEIEIRLRKKLDSITQTSRAASEEEQIEQLEQNLNANIQLLKDAYELGIIPTEERYNDYLLKLEENYDAEKEKLLEKMAEKTLREITAEENIELQQLKLQKAQMLLTEEQYEKRVLEIRRKYLEKRKEVANLSKESIAEIVEKEYEQQTQEAENANEKLLDLQEQQIQTLKSAVNQFADTMEDVGDSIADALFGDEEALKQAGKEFLKFALDVVEKFIMIKQAQILAEQIAMNAGLGPAGIAKATMGTVLKMAAIKAAFGLAKGVINNFYTGGYTAAGKWNEPKGIVHSNEFVANRFATANPDVNSVLRVIDAAQRSGSIGNLSGADLARVAASHNTKGHTSTSVNGSQASPIPVDGLISVMGRIERTMQKATDAYEKPSQAFCYVEGKGGINEAQDLATKMKRNAARK